MTNVTYVLFTAIHDILIDDLANGLADHSQHGCIVCTPEAASSEDEVGLLLSLNLFLIRFTAPLFLILQ